MSAPPPPSPPASPPPPPTSPSPPPPPPPPPPPASITGVVDRLEQAGFVRRERDAVDRRRVVIHLDAPRALRSIGPVFGPMMGAWQRMAAQYSDDELRLIVEFYGQMEQVIREHLDRLREGQAPSE